jgi:ABC-type transporter Mla subunit MlaD
MQQIRRNNVIAGLFVVASLFGAIAISVILSDLMRRFESTSSYVVHFPLAVGARGLEVGSRVLLGGQEIGRVAGLGFRRVGEQEQLSGIDVDIHIDSDIELYRNAVIVLEQPILGSLSTINILAAGDPNQPLLAPGTPPSTPRPPITGRLAPGLLAQTGFGPEQVEELKTTLANARRITERIDTILAEFEPHAEPIFENADAAVADVRAITADLREREPAWAEKFDGVLDTFAGVSQNVREIADGIGDRSEQARELIGTAQAILDENREPVRNTIASVESASRKIDQETLEDFGDTLDEAGDGIAGFSELVGTMTRTLETELPGVRKMLANFRLASDQLKLAAIEIRRAPWRLLYRPNTRELDSELLYDAARAYAMAVSDLRAASEALDALSRDGRATDPETINAMRNQLDEAFSRYDQAEQDFLGLLVERQK